MFNLEIWKTQKQKLKLTFDDIAEISQISRRTICGIFSGEMNNPSINTIKAIEKALNIKSETKNENDNLTKNEKELLTAFRLLNNSMQVYIIQMVKSAVTMQESQSTTENINKKIGG